MINNLKQSNILLCGSSRVGKSTLINAICQQQLAQANASLNSLTKHVQQYSIQYSDGKSTHETIIWDTPGIESWDENDVRSCVLSLFEETTPLCMIYCASPGSFAILDHLAWFIAECHRRKIFCALVCTNMWSGRNRQEVVNEFCRIVSSVHPNIQPNQEGNITYYDHVALVTMVNSITYVDEDFGVVKPPSGVDELIFGIGKCLKRDLMFAWFRTVSQNASFWTNMSAKLSDLFHLPMDKFNSLYQTTTNFIDSLFDFSITDCDNTSIIPDNPSLTAAEEAEESIFHDAEVIDMPEEANSKKLTFTFKIEDATMMAELNQILAKLGAKSCKTDELNRECEQLFVTTAEFENVEHLEAIYKIWQWAKNPTVDCQIV